MTLGLMAFPAGASAADFAGELSADTPKFEWAGEGTGIPIDVLNLLGNGSDSPFGCGTGFHDCDYARVDVKHPGDITILAEADGGQSIEGTISYPDIDVSFYKAAADGSPEGDSLSETECAGGSVPETCVVKDVAAGKYVVEVSFFLADASTYKASLTLKTLVPPTPAGAAPAPAAGPAPAPGQPAPAQQQPAQQQPAPANPAPAPASPKPTSNAKAKRAACVKKAKKKFKGKKNSKKLKKALKKCKRIK